MQIIQSDNGYYVITTNNQTIVAASLESLCEKVTAIFEKNEKRMAELNKLRERLSQQPVSADAQPDKTN